MGYYQQPYPWEYHSKRIIKITTYLKAGNITNSFAGMHRGG